MDTVFFIEKQVAESLKLFSVICNGTSGRVTGIDLPFMRARNIYEDWYLNASLLLPFECLQYLDLSGNNIASCIENHGFGKLSRHSRLKKLYLNGNKFSNSVIIFSKWPTVFGRTNLSSNRLKGIINVQDEMNNLPSLKKLYIHSNEIEDFEVYDGSQSSPTLNNLELLTLGYNCIHNNSLSFLQKCPSLRELDLSGNRINGLLNLEGQSYLTKLSLSNVTENGLQIVGASQYLRIILMSQNKFEGPIFSGGNLTNVEELNLADSFLDELALASLDYLSSLKVLYISNLNDKILAKGFPHFRNLQSLNLTASHIAYNDSLQHIGLCNLNQLQDLRLYNSDFKGALPDCFANLTYLKSFILYSNHLKVPISLSPLLNCSNLTNLEIVDSEIFENMELQSLTPKFQLQVLSLSGHGFTSSFPKFLYHQDSLSQISIENIQIRGEFPNWLLENNTKLESLILVNLSLGGSLQLPLHPHNSFSGLDISNNHIQGHIPSEIGNYLPQLSNLNMSGNDFFGNIPASVSNMSILLTFDLSNNGFSGQMPSRFCSSSMFHVFLSNNKIHGLPSDSVLNCSNILSLDLSYNSLMGKLPRVIAEDSVMSFLFLGHNHLTGEIPIELCKLEHLQVIDFSDNKLFGHIPSCLRYTTNTRLVMYPYGRDFTITTKRISLPYSVKTFMQFYGIDLSCNNLIGKIPPELRNISNILSLNLSHNNLIGLIPPALSNLRRLMSLDLSYNNLQGKSPSELTQLTFLSSFSVAHNNLSSKLLERAGQFGTFEESSYEGNPFLCGVPLQKSCISKAPPLQNNTKDDEDDNGFMDMTAFYASSCASYGVVLLGIFTVLYINPNWRRAWFYKIEVVINNVYYFLVDKILFVFGIKVFRSLV